MLGRAFEVWTRIRNAWTIRIVRLFDQAGRRNGDVYVACDLTGEQGAARRSVALGRREADRGEFLPYQGVEMIIV
jgi:hypothetical protein